MYFGILLVLMLFRVRDVAAAEHQERGSAGARWRLGESIYAFLHFFLRSASS